MINADRCEELLNKFHSVGPVLVIGDAGIDKYTYGRVSRISPEAPVPILEVTDEWTKLGLAANVSDNLKTMGVNSTLCGVIGDDIWGNQFEALLEDKGVTTWGILRHENRKTTYKERITTRTQQICRIDYEDTLPIEKTVFDKFIGRLDSFFRDHEIVIIEDYGKGLVGETLMQHVVSLGRKFGKKILLDPSRMSDPNWYRGVTLLKPNLQEAKTIAMNLGIQGDLMLDELARRISDKLDIEQVVITLGSEGMALYWRERDEFKRIPTFAREVFDVSGAGDTVIATLASSLIAGGNLEEAAWVANIAAGVVVGKRGTATVTIDEIMEFLKRKDEAE